jgi:hypothetical protein
VAVFLAIHADEDQGLGAYREDMAYDGVIECEEGQVGEQWEKRKTRPNLSLQISVSISISASKMSNTSRCMREENMGSVSDSSMGAKPRA